MGELKINYFKRLKKNKSILDRYDYPMKSYIPIGCSLMEIESLQKTSTVKFPKAYIEFLFLAGKNHRLFDSGIESEFSILEEIQNSFSIELKESRLKISRPIWAISMLHCEQFAFFFLDEKSENPKVYHYFNDWEEEPHSFNFNEIISSTELTISQYFDLRVPRKSESIASRILLTIADLSSLKFLKKK